jgi:hypothetical protein
MAINTAKNLNNIENARSLNSDQILNAIETANILYQNNTQYDYKFQKDNGTVYCTELVDRCYEGLFSKDYKLILGNEILLPDNISKSKLINIVTEVKH